MVEWWERQTVNTILLGVLLFQVVNLFHHWIVIYLKWKIYQITVQYLQAAEEEQVQTAVLLEGIKTNAEIVKGWAELARIQTSTQKEVAKDTQKKVDANTGDLKEEIKKVPKAVVRELTHDGDNKPSHDGDGKPDSDSFRITPRSEDGRNEGSSG